MRVELRPIRRRRIEEGALRLLAALVAVIFLLPLLSALSASLRETGAPSPRTIDLIPSPVTWSNYRSIFGFVELDRYIANSLIVAAVAVPATIVFASMAGFAISQFSGTWRARFLVLSVGCLMVPLTAIWIPRFILFKEAGLINKRAALMVPALMGTSPLYVLLFTWAFLRIPREVYEAAKLDGSGPYRMWLEIGLPLARPIAVSVGVLSFVHYWNSFVEPLLYMRTVDKMTASLGLRVIYQLDRTNWPYIMTGAIIVIAPVILLFIFAQRAYLQDRRGQGILGQ